MSPSNVRQDYAPWNLENYSDPGLLLREDEARSMIEACCEKREPAEIRRPGSKVEVKARFTRISDEILVMELDGSPEFRTEGPLEITFLSQHRRLKFIVPLREIREDEGGTRLDLMPPVQIRSTDMRRSCRIPMSDCLDLTAHFEFGGVETGGIVLDISNGGLCTDLLSSGEMDLKLGDLGRVVMDYQKLRTEHVIEIRNIRGSILHLSYLKDEDDWGM